MVRRTIMAFGALLLLVSGSGRVQGQAEHVFFMPQVPGVVGSPVVVPCSYDNNSTIPTQGVNIAVCIGDNSVLDLVSVDEGMDAGGTTAPMAVFFGISMFPGNGWTVGVVTDFLGMSLYVAGAQQLEIVQATYDVTTAGSSSLEFCDGVLGAPLVQNQVADTNSAIYAPLLQNGGVSSGPLGVDFIRGDTNSDGTVSGLQDGLFLLNFGFGGGDDPDCLEAADIDGDGELNSLLDALFVLGFQFLGGPPPPAPGTDCGLAPDNPLGCEVPSCP